ncbi:cache domain-containing protein, partial [Klebsiella pneumoniae]|nr:cache domain-containing protein [Klebsiella pneumoniae]
LVADLGERAQRGEISEEEARKRAIDHVKQLRYQGKEYFWINDLTPRMIMHPIKPELDGTDLSENKDPRGTYLFREFANI